MTVGVGTRRVAVSADGVTVSDGDDRHSPDVPRPSPRL